jgi:pantoate--beta-alanine ligase
LKLIKSVQEMQKLALKLRATGKSIGVVPTMGFLHEGHLSLARAARQENDLVVMTNFVNPRQFGPQEDFAAYPRDLERDSRLAESAGVDFLFAPGAEEMYPDGYCTEVEVTGEVTRKMCGRTRPTHFKGVTTVVLKLFLITQPRRAYFGQKDYQQAVVIRRMAADLNLPLEVVTCPIVREQDGLAMSSRNSYLSPEERREALTLSRALQAGAGLIMDGERRPEPVRERMAAVLQASPLVQIDYAVVYDALGLEEMERLQGRVLLAVAAWVGKTRLIDNLIVEV